MEDMEYSAEKSAPKRKREQEDSDEECVQTESHRLQLARSLQADLVSYLKDNSGSRMGTKEHFNFITEKVNQLVLIIEDQERFNHSIKTMEDKLEQVIQQRVPASPTFAAVVSGGQKARPAKKEVVIIEPTNDQQDAEATKRILKEKISPSALKIGVKSLRKIKKGGLVVEVAHSTDKTKLTTAIQSIPELKARDPKPRRPRVIVIGVPRNITKTDLPTLLYEQNEELQSMYTTLDSFSQQCTPRFQLGNKAKDTCNWILETSGKLHGTLIKMKRLNLEWVRCRVETFISILQCYNCCKIGHLAKNCSEAKPTCSQCAQAHRFKDCPNRATSKVCKNCQRDKHPDCQHNAFDRKCPSLQKMRTFLASRIDYGAN